MDPLVLVEGRPHSETLPALMACEGLLSDVDPLVGDEERPPAEGLPTVWTPIGGSTCCASRPPGLSDVIGSPHRGIPLAGFWASTRPH